MNTRSATRLSTRSSPEELIDSTSVCRWDESPSRDRAREKRSVPGVTSRYARRERPFSSCARANRLARLGEFAVDHDHDLDALLLRGDGSLIPDHAARDAGHLTGLPSPVRSRSPPHVVLVLAREDLLLRADEKEEEHQEGQRARHEEADPGFLQFVSWAWSGFFDGCAATHRAAFKIRAASDIGIAGVVHRPIHSKRPR